MTSQHDVLGGRADVDRAGDVAIADLRGESPSVRRTLAALGRLLGAALIDPPRNLQSFVTEHLASTPTSVATVTKVLFGVGGGSPRPYRRRRVT